MLTMKHNFKKLLKFLRLYVMIKLDNTDEMMKTLKLINYYIEEFRQREGKSLKEKLKKFNEGIRNVLVRFLVKALVNGINCGRII